MGNSVDNKCITPTKVILYFVQEKPIEYQCVLAKSNLIYFFENHKKMLKINDWKHTVLCYRAIAFTVT